MLPRYQRSHLTIVGWRTVLLFAWLALLASLLLAGAWQDPALLQASSADPPPAVPPLLLDDQGPTQPEILPDVPPLPPLDSWPAADLLAEPWAEDPAPVMGPPLGLNRYPGYQDLSGTSQPFRPVAVALPRAQAASPLASPYGLPPAPPAAAVIPTSQGHAGGPLAGLGYSAAVLPQADATITGRLTFTSGLPAAGYFVEVWAPNGSFNGTTDANGYYTFTVTPGTSTLASRTQGYTTQSSPSVNAVESGSYSNVNMVLLLNTAWVTGTVRDQNGTVVPFPNLAAADRGNGHHLTGWSSSDGAGTYVLPVAAGTWALDAWRPDYVRTVAAQEFVISTGITLTRDITLTHLHSVITGTVRDYTTNNPISGAGVWTKSEYWGTDTHSDARGVYTLTVYEGTWWVGAGAADHSGGGVSVSVGPDAVAGGKDISLYAFNAAIRGSIKDPGANPIAGATAEANGPGWYSKTQTDASGAYTLTVFQGDWNICAYKQGYLYQQPPCQQKWVADGGEVAGIDFVLAPATAWAVGSVLIGPGGPGFPNAWVWTWPYHKESNLGSGTSADAGGSFTLGLQAGTWYLISYPSGYTLRETPIVTATDGVTLTGQDLVVITNTATITGTVKDQNGNPVTDARIIPSDPATWHPLNDGANVSAGKYSLGIAAGTWLLRVESGTYVSIGRQAVTVTAGSTVSNVNFSVWALDATITGTVRDDGGNRLSDAGVCVFHPYLDWKNCAKTDGSGVYALQVYTGTWTVNADKQGYRNVQRDIHVDGGQTLGGQDFTLTALNARIQGTVRDLETHNPIPGARVTTGYLKEWGTEAFADASGAYTLTVWGGDWWVSCDANGYMGDGRQASVGSGGTTTGVDLNLQPINAWIVGTVRSPGGTPIPGANLDVKSQDGKVGFGGLQSDAGGVYTAAVYAGSWQVWAHAPGYMQGNVMATVGVSQTLTGQDIILPQATAWIVGTLRRETGGALGVASLTPVPYHWVWANRYQGKDNNGTSTDASGVFTLGVNAGNWYVATRDSNYTLQRTPLVALVDTQVLTGTDLVLLPHNATVAGRVLDQADNPVDGADVIIRDGTTGDWLQDSTRADASGYYTMAVAAGTWKIRAEKYAYASPPDQQFTVVTGTTATKDLVLQAMLARIIGTVKERGSETPLPGANVWAWNPKQVAGESNPPGQTTDAAGVYTMPVYAGQWYIDAGKDGWTRVKSIERVVTDTQVLTGADIHLPKGSATIRGNVVISGGIPYPYAYVETWLQSKSDSQWNGTNAGGSGVYSMPVSAGDWVIAPNVSGYTAQRAPLVSGVGPTATVTQDLVLLTNTAVLSGTVMDQYGFPVPNAHIEIRDAQTNGRVIPWDQGFVDSLGKYHLGIAPGTWKIGVWRDTYAFCDQTFSVAGGQTLDLHLVMTHFDTVVKGTLRDDHGAVITQGVVVAASQYSGCAKVGATSDVDGSYAISITKGLWGLSANSLPGYLDPPQHTVAADYGQTLSGYDLVYMSRDNAITGTVRNSAGVPVSGTTVTAFWAKRSVTAVTDASGRYSVAVPPGNWSVSVPPSGSQTVPRSRQATLAGHGQAVGSVELAYITSTATIRGVLTAGGAPKANIGINASRSDGAYVPSVATDAGGAYTFTVAPGDWQISVKDSVSGYSNPPARGVSVGAGGTVAGVDFALVPQTGGIRGQFTLNGVPVGGLGSKTSGNLSWGPSPGSLPQTDAGGLFTATFPAGHWRLDPPTYPFYTVPPKPGIWLTGSQTVTVQLNYVANDSWVTGQVRDSAHAPLLGIEVSASKVGTGENVNSVTTNASGRYTISLSAGWWNIASANDRPGYAYPPGQTVRVQAGQTVAGVDLEFGLNTGSISGRVTQGGVPVAGVSFFATDPVYGMAVGKQVGATTDNDGRYILRVPPGIWTVGLQTNLGGYVTPGTQVVAVNSDVTGLDFDYALADRTIKGTVRAGGVPRAGIWLGASRTAGPAGMGTTTDANGAYTLYVTADIWTVGVSGDLLGYARPPAQRADAMDGSVTDLDFAFLPASGTVTGRLLNDSAQPMVGARAGASWHLSNQSPTLPSVWADATGAYTLPIPTGVWQVYQSTSLGGLVRPTSLGTSISGTQIITGADLVYAAGTATLGGTVRDGAGNPVNGVWVNATDLRTGRSDAGAATNPDGRFLLNVTEGLWQLGTNTVVPGHTPPAYRSVQVVSGENLGNLDLQYLAATGSIVGAVRTSGGSGLAGIPLTLYNQSGSNAPGLTSDAGGRYTVTVAPGVWTVQPGGYLAGYAIPGSRQVTVGSGATVTQDFTFTVATLRIQGTVQDDAAGAIAGLRLDPSYADGPSGGYGAGVSATTDAAGHYSLRVSSGLWSLQAPGPLPGYVDQSWVEAYMTSTNVTANLTYSRTTRTISGRVAVDGAPLGGSYVSASWMGQGTASFPWTYSDRNGNYTLQVVPGSYVVSASASGRINPNGRYVTVTTASLVNVDLALTSPTGWLSGIVRDGEGRPLSRASVWLLDKDGAAQAKNTSGSLVPVATTNQAGAYLMPVGVVSGAYIVQAAKLGYAPATAAINYTTGWSQVVNLTLAPQPWATINGRVTSGGNAVAAFISHLRLPGSTWGAATENRIRNAWMENQASADGRFFLTGLLPGSYTLRTLAVGYTGGDVSVSVGAGGEATADVSMTATAVPTAAVGYGWVNMPVTMSVGSTYNTLVRLVNLGSATWPSGGASPVQVGYRWRDAFGTVVLTETAASTMGTDVPSGVSVTRYPAVHPPSFGGVYTITWDLVQGGTWFASLGASTESIRVTVLGAPPPVDLGVNNNDLWVSPPVFRAGSPATVTLGLNVHNNADQPVADVGVCFRDNGAIVGSCPITITLIPPHDIGVITTVWNTAGLTGTRVVNGTVDPSNRISETLETNNVATRTVTVLPPAPDITAPVGSLVVNGGVEATPLPSVTLALTATDAGGSGLRWMQVVEFAFDLAQKQWNPVQSSGWLSFSTSYPWTLTSGGGARLLRAWFADGANNVSAEPAYDWINLITACDSIGTGQWKLYGMEIAAGSLVTLTLSPCTADPDLYVWSPGSQGEPDFYSSNAGVARDVVNFTAPANGFYRIYAYGYLAATFNLYLSNTVSLGALDLPVAPTRILAADKTLPSAPPAAAEEPPAYTPPVTIVSYGVSLAPGAAAQSGVPGATVTYTLRVTNTGSAQETYTVTAKSAWTTTVAATAGPILADNGADLTVAVIVPSSASPGVFAGATVTVTSRGDPSKWSRSVLTTTALNPCVAASGPDLSFTPSSPLVGELVTLTGTVAGGTPPITYTWGFGDGATGTGQVTTHTFPLTATIRAYTVTLTATNTCPSLVTWQEAVTVRPRTIYLPLVMRTFGP